MEEPESQISILDKFMPRYPRCLGEDDDFSFESLKCLWNMQADISLTYCVPGSVLINIIGVSSSFNVCNLGPLS